MEPFGAVAVLDEGASADLWRRIRDVTPLAADGSSGERPLWRISTAPTAGAELARLAAGAGAEMLYDWAGGLLWLALPPSDDAGAAAVRRAVAACGGGEGSRISRADVADFMMQQIDNPQWIKKGVYISW